jgi:hypothetical protein
MHVCDHHRTVRLPVCQISCVSTILDRAFWTSYLPSSDTMAVAARV